MKLYQTTHGTFCGTQDEFFKAQIAQTGGQRRDYNAETVEVPTDKQGLIDWLNSRGYEAEQQKPVVFEHVEAVQALGSAETYVKHAEVVAKPTPAPAQPPAQSPNWRADSVMEWLLNEASTAQVEQLFARLGTRFAEQAK